MNAINAEVTWELSDYGTLTISGTGDMESASLWYQKDNIKKVIIEDGVTSIGGNAFSGCTSLTSITVPNSVTSIGFNAFADCSGLTSITIPKNVTSIGDYAFDGCSGLTSITIPNNVTSIGRSTFNSCTGLTSVTIPDGVASIGDYAFYKCTGLTSITIPNSVAVIGDWAFYGCSGLTSITIPNSVTSIGYSAFYGCTGLTSITIPHSVTSIGGSAFSGCSELSSIDFPNASNCDIGSNVFYNTKWFENVGDYDYVYFGDCLYRYKGIGKTATIKNGTKKIWSGAFLDCSSLTSVTIPNSVTSIGDAAFSSCTGLTSITIPNSVTSIGERAFYYCTSLTSVSIPDNITSIGDEAFDEYSSITSSNTPNNVLSIGKFAFGYCYNLISIDIPSRATSIGTSAFWECYSLSSITIPNMTSIGRCAFTWCASLTSINISNCVTTIEGSAFQNCVGLTSITIPKNVTNIESTPFNGCTGLTSIKVEEGNAYYDSRDNCNAIINKSNNELIAGCRNTIIPNSVTSIGTWAFSRCTGLTSITIPNSVKTIDKSAFNFCYMLKENFVNNSNCDAGDITFIDSDTEQENGLIISNNQVIGCRPWATEVIIPDGVTSIARDALWGCTDITSLIIPNSVTNIDKEAFNTCMSPISLTIPNSITSIDRAAFSRFLGLTSINIPNSVTDIGSGAFQYCIGLKSITIPNSVTSIGDYVFYYCSNLNRVTIDVNKDLQIAGDAFSLCNAKQLVMRGITLPKSINYVFTGEQYNTCTLYVPSSLYNEYCSTSPWKQFANIVMIPDGTIALLDGITYTNQEQYDGQEISYTRTFYNTSWQALYIPFSMSYEDWKDDFEVAYINSIHQYDKDDDGVIDETTMEVVKIKNGSLIPNTPYLIKAKTTGEMTITVTGATLYKAEENSIECSTMLAKYTFTGTYSTIPASTLIDNSYYAMGGGSLVITDGTSDLRPFRWYMKIDARSPMYNVNLDAKPIAINVVGEEEATGINELRMTNDELPVYDLNGRRVDENNLKPGFYIKNGKKVIIK